jgi:tetratricopeptide (TPR) repeat protein
LWHADGEANYKAGAMSIGGPRSIEDAIATLTTDEKLLGEGHPDTLADMSNLAVAYREAGQFQQARVLLERALAIRRRTSDPEDYSIQRTALQLSTVLRSLGELSLARDIQEEVLANCERAYGGDNNVSLIAAGQLAETLRDQGDLGPLVDLERRIVESRCRSLGESDLETLRAMTSLAETLRAQGEYGEAKEIDTSVLNSSQRNNVENRVVIAAKLNLLKDLAGLGDFRGRDSLISEISADAKRLLPKRDPLRQDIERFLDLIKPHIRVIRNSQK